MIIFFLHHGKRLDRVMDEELEEIKKKSMSITRNEQLGQQEAIWKFPEHRDRCQNWKFQEDRDCRRQIPRSSRQMDKLGQESTKRKIQRARRSWRSRRVSWALRQWVTWLQSYVFMTSVFVFDFEFTVVSERLHMFKSLFVSANVQRVFLFVPIVRNMYHPVTEVCLFHI